MISLFKKVTAAAFCSCAILTSALAGQTVLFGAPVQISATGQRTLAPDIALGMDGILHVLWVSKAPPPKQAAGQSAGMNHDAADELFYRRSIDGDQRFDEPVRVNRKPGDVWGIAVSKPQLSVSPDGSIHVMFTGNAVQAGTGKAILVARYARSVDNGQTFEPSRTLNSSAKNDLSAVMHGGFAAAHAFGTLTTDESGGVHVYWIDTRWMVEGDTVSALFAATSRDNGKTFASDSAVYKTNVCPCCQLDAATRDEQVFLSTRWVFAGGSRDSAVAISNDSGEKFAEPTRLGEGRWIIEGCPLKRTAIDVSGEHVYTAWYTAGQDPAGVYFAGSSDGGVTYEESIAMHPDALVSDAPSVAALDDGTVFVAWHAKTGGARRVFVRVSIDHGESFSAPVEVPAPEGTAAYPEIVAGGGRAYLAWQQDESVYVISLERAGPVIAVQ